MEKTSMMKKTSIEKNLNWQKNLNWKNLNGDENLNRACHNLIIPNIVYARPYPSVLMSVWSEKTSTNHLFQLKHACF